MKAHRFELLCAAMLGFGQLCIMTGYDSESFLLESVIHSIHEREPERLNSYAGYYGQAVLYAVYVVTCLFSPSILNVTNAKITLFIASCCFTAFPIGFLFTNSYYFYISSAVLGFGFALFYQGQGGYLTSHSTRTSISSNVSISWSLGCCCMILGAGIMAGVTTMTSKQIAIDLNSQNITSEQHKVERRFSDFEITLLFASFAAISSLGMINFLLMPSKDIEDCIESSEKRGSFVETLKLTCQTLISPKMIQLLPLFAFCGVHTSFWLSIVPTAMNFNMHNSNLIYLSAIYACGVGMGEVIMGISISALNKKFNDFGLRPTMIIGAFLTIVYCMMVLATTPFDAPIRPTHEVPLLFQQTRIIIFVIAFIAGLSDCCINSVRGTICAVVMPKQRAQAFSISKLYQALASCIIYFLSPHLNIYYYTIGLPILAIFATVLFFHVARKTQRMERKLTIEQNKKAIIDFVECMENAKC